MYVAQIDEWAQVIADWAHSYGVHDTVMLLDELSSGDDVTGTGGHQEGMQWVRGYRCLNLCAAVVSQQRSAIGDLAALAASVLQVST